MPFFERDGINFYYEVKGQGIPFLALHGLGGNLNQPLGLLDQVPGLQIISLDFRGHGQTLTDCSPAQVSMKVFAEDAIALLDFLEIEEAIIGGISLGAAIALKMALLQPSRFSGMVLIRPAWLDKALPPNLKPFVQISQLIQVHDLETAEDLFYNTKELQIIKEFYPNAAASLLGQFSRPQAAENPILLDLLPKDKPIGSLEELSALKHPSLVVATKHDPLHPYDFGEKLGEMLPKGKFVECTSRYVNARKHQEEVTIATLSFLKDYFA